MPTIAASAPQALSLAGSAAMTARSSGPSALKRLEPGGLTMNARAISWLAGVRLRAVAGAVALCQIGGCASFVPEPWEAGVRGKTATAEEALYVHVVAFADGSDRLTIEQRGRLDRFLTAVAAGSTDFRIGSDDAGPLADRRRAVVGAYLLHRLPNARAIEPAIVPENGGGGVRIEARTYVVRIPGCPDWTDRPGRTFSNVPNANWGCATAQNFGLMVAEPADLAIGRQPQPMDGMYAAGGIER